MPTIARILQLGPPSCYLASNYKDKSQLFSGKTPQSTRNQAILIYIYHKILKRIYDLDHDYPGLAGPANYLYELEQKFAFKAANIVDGGGGGSVTPVTPASGLLPNDIDWLVSDTATGLAPLADGETYVLLNGDDGMPDLRGLKINFDRGGSWQNTTPLGDGSTYYYWNKITGLFQLFGGHPANGAAQTGELMRISPDLLGSGATFENLNEPQTIFLDADGTYTLAEGFMIWKITIKPTAADTVRIGTTANGEEVMLDKVMTPNVYSGNGVTADVEADGASQIIYFTGFTSQAQINIYLLPI